MPEKIIISDTSSLIALTNIGELELLKKVYGEVVITPEIGEEYGLETPDWIRIEKLEKVDFRMSERLKNQILERVVE
jgi:predicted nucleic acid-binding protein